jgi:hypothetical protein
MKELDHQAGESLKCPGNADCRADFDEDTLGSVDVYLEFPSLVDGRVEQGEKTLYCRADKYSPAGTGHG